jgi:hypothetical protein
VRASRGSTLRLGARRVATAHRNLRASTTSLDLSSLPSGPMRSNVSSLRSPEGTEASHRGRCEGGLEIKPTASPCGFVAGIHTRNSHHARTRVAIPVDPRDRSLTTKN